MLLLLPSVSLIPSSRPALRLRPAVLQRGWCHSQHRSTADELFDEAVALCEARAAGELCDFDFERVPDLLDEVFARDEHALWSAHYRDATHLRSLTNLTCLQPLEGVEGVQVFNDELLALHLNSTKAT